MFLRSMEVLRVVLRDKGVCVGCHRAFLSRCVNILRAISTRLGGSVS